LIKRLNKTTKTLEKQCKNVKKIHKKILNNFTTVAKQKFKTPSINLMQRFSTANTTLIGKLIKAKSILVKNVKIKRLSRSNK